MRPSSLFRATTLALGLTALALSTTACRPQPSSDPSGELGLADAEAHAAKLERWLAKHPEDHDARVELALVYWQHLGRVDEALDEVGTIERLTPNLVADPPPPLARFIAMMIAHNRLDHAAASEAAGQLLLELGLRGSARNKRGEAYTRQARALSPLAARVLDANYGLEPESERAFVELFDLLDARHFLVSPAPDDWDVTPDRYLPAATRSQLLSTRGRIARTRGEAYRDFYAAQGCVQDWQVGALEGHRGALELDRVAGGEVHGFQVDAEASLTGLSCAVRVWNPEPAAGMRRLRTQVRMPEGSEFLRLALGAQFPARVYVDGELVWASDRTDRYPVGSPSVRVPATPGPHLVELHTAIPSERAWVLARATDEHGQPLTLEDPAAEHPLELPALAPALARADALVERAGWTELGRGGRARAMKLDGPVYAPLRAYLALDEALILDDTDAAEGFAQALSDRDFEGLAFPDAHLLLAQFERRDPSRGKSSSGVRQQTQLERALELDPGLKRAHLQLLEQRLNRGESAEVVEAFEDLEHTGNDSLLLALLRYEAYRAEGSDVQSQAALEVAAAYHPTNCEVLAAQREQARDRGQIEAEDALVEVLERCPGSLAMRARQATARQRIEAAKALWSEQLDRVPDDMEAMEALAQLAVTAGNYAEAIAWHDRILRLAPYRAVSMVALADLHAQLDAPEQARAFVLAAIERFPHNSRLREIGENLGIPDPLMAWRIDGREALADYERDRAEGLASEGVSEVLLLDREVSMMLPDGGHRHIVHQMFHLLSDAAIDAHGEIEQPGNLLTLRSIKPDGRVVEPESIAGKDGLSLRGLEIGDVVELEFSFDAAPEAALPGHVDLGRFRFQSPETPFHRSELITLVPASEQGRVDVEARNDAPAEARRELELPFAHGPDTSAYVELRYRADRVPRLGSEPAARSMLDELPMVQVHVPLAVEDWLDTVAAQLRPSQRSNPELRALAVEITEQYSSDYDKVDALWRWVVDEIEETGDLTTPATLTLAARQGGRLMLLRAMLEAVGIDSELWLLRDRFGPTIVPGGNPLVETYDASMLAIPSARPPGAGADAGPLVIGTSSEVIPLGYLTPSYARGRALRVQLEADEPPPGPVDVPASPPEHADLRRWELQIDLDAEGNGRLQGRLELRGLEAIFWRQAFTQLDADELPKVFTQAELQRILPIAATDLESLEFDNDWELQLPLVARFTATVRNGGVVQGAELATLAAAVPLDLVTGYAQLPERWSGLVVGYAPRLEARVAINLDGRRFSEVPGDVELTGASGRGRYTRALLEGGVGESQVVFESTSSLTPGVFEVSEYGELTRFSSQVQNAEQQILRAR